MRVLWLADLLRAWGLTVVETDGWQTRGRPDIDPVVVIVHHTASAQSWGVAPSLNLVIKGRAPSPREPNGVPGPLCNVLLGRDCRAFVIASGVSNNAGAGRWGRYTSNRRTIGIEVENNGIGEPWSPQLYDATVLTACALAEGTGLSAAEVIGHKEWAPLRKIDPSFEMGLFRHRVARLLVSTPPAVEEDFMSRVLATGGPFDAQSRVPHWLVHKDGGVEARNGAPFYGSLPGEMIVRDDIVGIIPRPGFRDPNTGELTGYTLVCAQVAPDGTSPTFLFPI